MIAQAVYDTAPRAKGAKVPQLINHNPWRQGITARIRRTRGVPIESPLGQAMLKAWAARGTNGN